MLKKFIHENRELKSFKNQLGPGWDDHSDVILESSINLMSFIADSLPETIVSLIVSFRRGKNPVFLDLFLFFN